MYLHFYYFFSPCVWLMSIYQRAVLSSYTRNWGHPLNSFECWKYPKSKLSTIILILQIQSSCFFWASSCLKWVLTLKLSSQQMNFLLHRRNMLSENWLCYLYILREHWRSCPLTTKNSLLGFEYFPKIDAIHVNNFLKVFRWGKLKVRSSQNNKSNKHWWNGCVHAISLRGL